MSRLSTWFFGAALVVGATVASCGGGGDGGTGGTGGGGSSGTGGSGGGGATSVGSLLDIVGRVKVTDWTVDPSNTTTAGLVAATGTTETQVTNLIDGAAADFFAAPFTPTNFAWQNYVNAKLPAPIGASAATLKLYILELPDAGQAESLYASLLNASLYKGNEWTDPAGVGGKSRITDSGSDWWVNFVKGKYYVEVRMSPSYGAAPDYVPGNTTTKQAAIAFATAVAAQM